MTLTANQEAVLNALNAEGRSLNTNQLAAYTGLSSASVRRCAEHLRKQGRVVRETRPDSNGAHLWSLPLHTE